MPNNPPDQSKSTWQALSLAWELGYTISVPLVVLALAGRFLDKWFKTSPWLLLAGVFLSIIITTWIIYRKTKVIVTAGFSASTETKDKETKV